VNELRPTLAVVVLVIVVLVAMAVVVVTLEDRERDLVHTDLLVDFMQCQLCFYDHDNEADQCADKCAVGQSLAPFGQRLATSQPVPDVARRRRRRMRHLQHGGVRRRYCVTS